MPQLGYRFFFAPEGFGGACRGFGLGAVLGALRVARDLECFVAGLGPAKVGRGAAVGLGELLRDIDREGDARLARGGDDTRGGAGFGDRGGDDTREGAGFGDRGGDDTRGGAGLGVRGGDDTREGAGLGVRGGDDTREGAGLGVRGGGSVLVNPRGAATGGAGRFGWLTWLGATLRDGGVGRGGTNDFEAACFLTFTGGSVLTGRAGFPAAGTDRAAGLEAGRCCVTLGRVEKLGSAVARRFRVVLAVAGRAFPVALVGPTKGITCDAACCARRRLADVREARVAGVGGANRGGWTAADSAVCAPNFPRCIDSWRLSLPRLDDAFFSRTCR